MIVKCGRIEFELTEKDLVMYNGACYQIITRKVGFGWNESTPIIAKSRAMKLIKEGLLKEVQLDKPRYKGENIIYYSI
jgi:hypothetical protein